MEFTCHDHSSRTLLLRTIVHIVSITRAYTQVRIQNLRFGGAKYIFRVARFFFLLYFQNIFLGTRKFWGNCPRLSPPWLRTCLHATITLLLLIRATYIYCCFSRTSRSWWITYLTQRQPTGCNTIVFFGGQFLCIFFGQVWGNLGKNSSYLQKFACSYTYDWKSLKSSVCQIRAL